MSMPPGGAFVPEPEGANALAASLEPIDAAAIAAEIEAAPRVAASQQDSQFGYGSPPQTAPPAPQADYGAPPQQYQAPQAPTPYGAPPSQFGTPAPPPPPPQLAAPVQYQSGYAEAPQNPQATNPLQQNPQQQDYARTSGVSATQQLSGVMYHTEEDNSPGRNSLAFAAIGWLLGGLAYMSLDGLSFVSLVLFVLGVVFGAKGINKSRAGRATNGTMAGWGLGLSIAGLVAIVVQIVLTVLFFAAVLDEASGWIEGSGGYDLGTVPTTIEVGDCFEDPYLANSAGAEGWVAFKELPCTQPHYAEVYFRGTLSTDAVDVDTSIFEVAGNACLAEFTGATGEDYLDSEWFIDYFYPTKAEWDAGLREYTCALI